MQIQIITNEASFFERVFGECRRLHPKASIQHCSEEAWGCQQPAFSQPHNVYVRQRTKLRMGQGAENSENAFAVIGSVCQNSTEGIHWVPVSRNDFVLWLRELSPMTSEPAVVEDIVFQTPYVRLAHFRIPTNCRLIPAVRDRLMRGLKDYNVVEGTRENHFCMALEEALNNAFYHGNLEISSELKEDGSSRFLDLAAERELLSPWCHRSVLVTELVSAFGLWITIQDEGHGFNVQAAFDRCDDPEALLASGRGLLLMRGFSDEIFFNTLGNEVTLVLYADGVDRELPLGTASSSDVQQRQVVI